MFFKNVLLLLNKCKHCNLLSGCECECVRVNHEINENLQKKNTFLDSYHLAEINSSFLVKKLTVDMFQNFSPRTRNVSFEVQYALNEC